MKRYQDTHKPLILAHRGGAGESPENTRAAFQHALDVGITHLETDVRVAANGVLYLTHNATSLLPDRPLTLRSDSHLLSLKELFAEFPDSFFAIDPKQDSAIEPLAKLIVEHGLEERVCIGSSFDGRTERTAHLIEKLSGKRPCTALVSGSAVAKLILSANHLKCKQRDIQATYIHVPAGLVTHRTVRAAHDSGLKIIAWVLNDKASIQNALDLGADGFMTDYPTIAMETVGPQIASAKS